MAFYNITNSLSIYKSAKLKLAVLKTVLILSLFLATSLSYAQNISSKKDQDSTGSKIENLLKLDQEKSNALFKENKISRERSILFDAISKNVQVADLTLKTGIDYKGFTTELNNVIKLKKTAIDGIIKNKNDFQTLRNITVTSIMLKELQTRLDIQLAKIKKNNLELSEMQTKIDSLMIKKSLFTAPKDSIRKSLYYERYSQMNADVLSLNKRFKNALDSISKLQILANNFKYDLQNDIIETDNIRKDEFTNLFDSDGKIFEKSSNKMGFEESFLFAYQRANHFGILYKQSL